MAQQGIYRVKKILIAILVASVFLAPSAHAGKIFRFIGKAAVVYSIKKAVAKKTAKLAIEPRPKFRKSTIENAKNNAKHNPDGTMDCPTCETKITGGKVNNKRDFDVDHKPTWNSRKKAMREVDPPLTRKEVVDEYQRNVRIQCPECNRSHKFEEN